MDAKRATLRDVAAAAGVSRALAGFVLGDDHGKSIPEPTRERVRAAARNLGYVPHGIARALREGSARVVVLSIDPSLESNYSRTFARGLNDELAAHGHLLLVLHEHSAPVPERQILDTISPRAVIRLPGNYLTAGHELDDGGWEGGFAANILVQVRYLADRSHAAIAPTATAAGAGAGALRSRGGGASRPSGTGGADRAALAARCRPGRQRAARRARGGDGGGGLRR